ncbi:hypothetical protein TIFTF001_045883 [Ficus carica]|uniref:Uncharacterized protein n=1 Tax=Ficus carica TaxID=3494 RepID=A0AA87ZBN9_FICCA|nr:hypothetical protein TIFTF001_045883 [Ficus carica]
MGGAGNEAIVRAKPSINKRSSQQWGHCCDRFMSPTFQSQMEGARTMQSTQFAGSSSSAPVVDEKGIM